MKFSMLFAAVLATVSATGEAQSIVRPRIIVAISVDQFSADLFTEYRALFKAGLHRLQTGIVFSGGYQSHARPSHKDVIPQERGARATPHRSGCC